MFVCSCIFQCVGHKVWIKGLAGTKSPKYVFKGKKSDFMGRKKSPKWYPSKYFVLQLIFHGKPVYFRLIQSWKNPVSTTNSLLPIVQFVNSLAILLFLLSFIFPFVCYAPQKALGTCYFITAKGKQGRHKVQNINFVMVFNLEIFHTIQQLQLTTHLFVHSKRRTIFSSFYSKVVKVFLYYNNLK